MVHLYCKSAPALTFENLLQDICQEACDAVHKILKSTLISDFTTHSSQYSLYYTLFATPLHYTPTRGAQILKSTLLVTLYGKNTRALTF